MKTEWVERTVRILAEGIPVGQLAERFGHPSDDVEVVEDREDHVTLSFTSGVMLLASADHATVLYTAARTDPAPLAKVIATVVSSARKVSRYQIDVGLVAIDDEGIGFPAFAVDLAPTDLVEAVFSEDGPGGVTTTGVTYDVHSGGQHFFVDLRGVRRGETRGVYVNVGQGAPVESVADAKRALSGAALRRLGKRCTDIAGRMIDWYVAKQ